MMRNMRCGIFDEDHTKYTMSASPSSIFNKGTSGAIYDPTGRNDASIAEKILWITLLGNLC